VEIEMIIDRGVKDKHLKRLKKIILLIECKSTIITFTKSSTPDGVCSMIVIKVKANSME
jgi:hypothetical protein